VITLLAEMAEAVGENLGEQDGVTAVRVEVRVKNGDLRVGCSRRERASAGFVS
jgi:hypothetical protein